ncbi:ABC transporter permease [Bacteroidota bacterium]
MIKNFFKTTFRNFWKHRSYSIINITGLTIGMACSILILLWVKDEMSFDNFHKNGKNIYRVLQHVYFDEEVIWGINQGPLGPALKEEIPEIKDFTRFRRGSLKLDYISKSDTSRNKTFTSVGAFVDPQFIGLFTFPMISGDVNNALTDVRSIVLTKTLAENFFGEENPIGKILNINDQWSFKISGIISDPPDNSHLQFEFLVLMKFGKELGFSVDRWNNSMFFTYVVLEDNASPTEVGNKIHDFLDDKPTLEESTDLAIQQLKDIHFETGIDFNNGGGGSMEIVIIFFITALFILFIACINFMNLSTARSATRSMEVGMKKVIGAKRSQVIYQFLFESFIFSLIALNFALYIVELVLPKFNQLVEKDLRVGYLDNYSVIPGLLGIVILTTILSGIYPSLFMSSFKPLRVLKGSLKSGSGGSGFRKGLVLFQFIVSIFLLTSTFSIYKQVKFLQNRDLGYNKENLILFQIDRSLNNNIESFKEELLKIPTVVSVSNSNEIPTKGYSSSNSLWSWPGKDPDKDVLFRIGNIGYDYIETIKAEMKYGRSFSKEFASDSTAIIINETALRIMGLENPIGQRIMAGQNLDFETHIIGVVKDYNFRSLNSEVEPYILRLNKNAPVFTLRISPDNIPATIKSVENTYKEFAPDAVFNHVFLDDLIGNLYNDEQKIGNILSLFTILGIIISALGLFGLASFMTEQKSKEIGVRKVSGASVRSIVIKLSLNFIQWILISFIIASPLAWYAIKQFLKEFPYKTPISWWIFALAGLTVLIIALITVSFQAIKAARKNPVDSLRYE